MDNNRICRISGRVCFLLAFAYLASTVMYIMGSVSTPQSVCSVQAMQSKDRGFITWNQFYYCKNVQTGKAYDPRDEEEFLAQVKRSKSIYGDTYEGLAGQSELYTDDWRDGLASGKLIGYFDYPLLFKTLGFCSVLLLIAAPIGRYGTKLILLSFRLLTR